MRTKIYIRRDGQTTTLFSSESPDDLTDRLVGTENSFLIIKSGRERFAVNLTGVLLLEFIPDGR